MQSHVGRSGRLCKFTYLRWMPTSASSRLRESARISYVKPKKKPRNPYKNCKKPAGTEKVHPKFFPVPRSLASRGFWPCLRMDWLKLSICRPVQPHKDTILTKPHNLKMLIHRKGKTTWTRGQLGCGVWLKLSWWWREYQSPEVKSICLNLW